jgi:hypothetical protein
MRARGFIFAAVVLAGCGGGSTPPGSSGSGGSGGTGGSGGSGGGGSGSVCKTFDPVDVFLNMNGAAAGTAVTDANLAAGTEIAANYSGWDPASPFQTFAASQVAMPAGVAINGGATHGCGYATQSLAHNAAGNFSTSSLNLENKTNVVMGGWIVNMPPDQTTKGDYFDMAQTVGNHGYSATIQLDSGTNDPACPAYGLEIESSGAATTHSACNALIVPGGTYFVQMHVNYGAAGSCFGAVAAPCAEMNVYTTAGDVFTQVGTTASVALGSTDATNSVNFGNNEGGVFAGTIYFQNWMVDYTNHAFPNLPH